MHYSLRLAHNDTSLILTSESVHCWNRNAGSGLKALLSVICTCSLYCWSFTAAAVSAVDFRSIPLRNAGQRLQKPYGMELTDPVAVPERIRRQASRIINGETATEGEFPHQATLLNDGSHMCGASIIADGWALTAGHCVDGQ